MNTPTETTPERYDAPVGSMSHNSLKTSPPDTTARTFSFDFERLDRMGFITPVSRKSRTSEEFRLIKRRLMRRMTITSKTPDGSPSKEHVILVTSSRPSEGKSFTAVNLALSIILDEGFNVLLIDGDVARPSLGRILDISSRQRGLTNILRSDSQDISSVMFRERQYPLSYIGAGSAVASATDLFSSKNMYKFMDDIANRYRDRIIIFDAPPLLASTEPVALAAHVGQIVMVVDANNTSRLALETALDLLDNKDNLNFVLNKMSNLNSNEQFGTYYETYNTTP